MSIGAINGLKNTVLDLLAQKPKAPEPRVDAPGLDKAKPEGRRGFNELLRDRSPDKRVDPSVRGETQAEEKTQVTSSKDAKAADQQDGDTGDSPEASMKSKDKAGETKNEQQAEDKAQKGGDDPASNQEEAESEQAAAAAQAQSSAKQGEAAALASWQLSSTLQTPQSEEEAKAQAGSPEAERARLAFVQAQGDTAGKQAAKDGGSPILNAAAITASATANQQDTSADAEGGEAKGQAQTAAQSVTKNAAAASNSNAATSFVVPDQSGDAPRVLPLQNTPGTAQVNPAQQAAAQQMPAAEDNEAVNTARLTRGLSNAVQQKGGAVTLRLTPPEMGTVRIQMQITGTNVSASFHAESASAQTLLTTQLAQLRSALETQGMNVERLSVQPLTSTAQSQSGSQSQNDANNQQGQQMGQQSSANDGRSRGQYSSQGEGGRHEDDAGGKPGLQRDRSFRGFFDRLQDAADPAA